MPNFKKDLYLKFIFLICLITIITAYYIEYILGYQPCNLCLIERVPYVLSIIILLVNYKLQGNEKYLVLLLICIFIISLIISLYHLGIELNFFQESPICSLSGSIDIISKEKLLEELQKRPISCKDVTIKIFGFSLTTVNIFISLFIIFILTKFFALNEKK